MDRAPRVNEAHLKCTGHNYAQKMEVKWMSVKTSNTTDAINLPTHLSPMCRKVRLPPFCTK